MKAYFLLIFAALAFSSCSRYDYYWHEEEDDVYFVSSTPEEVDIFSYDDGDDDTDTYNERTNYPDVNDYPRRQRRSRTYYPRTSYPRTTTGSPMPKTTKSPTSFPKTSPTSTPRPRPRSNPKSNPR